MLQLISVDLDRLQDIQTVFSRPTVFCAEPALALPKPIELLGNSVGIREKPTLDLSYPAGPRMLMAAERELLDRAFWTSVAVIDEGELG